MPQPPIALIGMDDPPVGVGEDPVVTVASLEGARLDNALAAELLCLGLQLLVMLEE